MSQITAKTPRYWNQAKAELSAADPIMGELIRSYPRGRLSARGDAFFTLARSVVGQQISVKAADSVWAKLEAVLPQMTPDALLVMDDEKLRGCGLSRQKMVYLREVAAYCAPLSRQPRHYQRMSDEAIIKELVAIKGIGRWSAEMFLIFHLMRPNLFPIDDIGLQRGIERHYHGGKRLEKNEFYAYRELWQPWNTVATWYLWRSLDPVPVAY